MRTDTQAGCSGLQPGCRRQCCPVAGSLTKTFYLDYRF